MDSFTKLGKVILQFSSSYSNGYPSVKILYDIQEIQRQKPEKYLIIPDFYNFLYIVCFQSAIINLSNILIFGKDTINIYYIRNLILDQNPSLTGKCRTESILALFQSIIYRYSENSDFYSELKVLRDKYIAHVDRSLVTNPKSISKQISLGEIKEAYGYIGELISRLIGEFAINPELIDYQMLDKANLQFRLLTDSLDQA
jgi:hypothetical protein